MYQLKNVIIGYAVLHFIIFAFLHCAKRLHEVGTALDLLEHSLSES